ncbi:MAG: amino acid adenylation domain-containing protein [Calditrichia bacterium]
MKKLKESGSAENIKSIISRRHNTDTYPMSFAQKRLWFMSQLEPESSFYNISAAIRLVGPLNISALKNTLNDIIRRHEMLRARFVLIKGEPVQKIVPSLEIEIPVTDITGLLSEQLNEKIQSLAVEEARRPFKLDKDPLLRVSLLKANDSDYVLLITMHHIIADGWSVGVFLREFSELYTAYVKKRKAVLPEIFIQYADYAQWQISLLDSEHIRKQLAYWTKQLKGMPPILELPTDRQRPAIQKYEGAHYSFKLVRVLSDSIRSFCKERGVSLFVFFLTVLKVLLYRYSHQTDFGVGIPLANRQRSLVENIIGFFVNTGVIRSNFRENIQFSELLKRVKASVMEAYDNQDPPFDKLVDILVPERELSHTPLYQVMFDMQKSAMDSFHLPDLSTDLLEVERGTAKTDLILTMEDSAGELGGTFEFNTDLFDHDTIHRMAGHYRALVFESVSRPNAQIKQLCILTEPEKRKIIKDWNTGTSEVFEEVCIHHVFESQAKKQPNAVALLEDNRRLTYGELNKLANQYAGYLRDLGVGPEVLVGICMKRSVEAIAAILAVLKAGGAYVPVDPENPRDRLKYIFEDAGLKILLTWSDIQENLPECGINMICLDRALDLISHYSTTDSQNQVSPSNLAYVIYTSGSTGRPKGTMLQHQGVWNLCKAIRRDFALGPGRVVLQFFSIGFDGSVADIFGAILNGGSLYLPEQTRMLSTEEWVSIISDFNIAHFLLPPSFLSGLPEKDIAGPKTFISGADLCTWDLANRWSQYHNFANAYGPTEATVASSWHAVKSQSAKSGSVPIGRPIDNVKFYILDRNLNPVPIGVSGELYIAGVNLARGYLHRPDLTAEKFIPNPFDHQSGSRLYKTGDLVRYLPDGNVEFLGRIDYQVKVRGFRIEIGEIEVVLNQHPKIKEALILAQEDTPGNKRLVAYIISAEKPDPSVSKLRSFLKEKLPEYMIPSAFVFLEKFPLNPNGKINRKALPLPELIRPNLSKEFVPPGTETENALAKIWQEVLGIEKVGIYDNFFELGGDSVQAAIVSNRIQELLGKPFQVKTIFLTDNIAQLASYIAEHSSDQIDGKPGQKDEIAIRPISRDRRLPLSFAQQRIWFLDQLEPGSPLYNIPLSVRIHGRLNVAILEKTINEIIRRHESLRTKFVNIDGEAFQEILPTFRIRLPIIDLSRLSPKKSESEARQIVDQEARYAFNLSQGSLIRCCLLKLGEDDFILTINMHHIISDGWSMRILINEMIQIYKAFARGQNSPLALPDIQYADYACWQREWLTEKVLENQINYWKRQLSDIPPVLELPTDYPRSAEQSHKGKRISFNIQQNLYDKITELCRSENITPYIFLLSAFQTLLFRYAGQSDISIGTPVAGRNRKELEDLIGFFVNTVVIRADLSDNPTFRQLLQRTRKITMEAHENQDVQFEKLVDLLVTSRDMSHTPLFQVMLSYDKFPFDVIDLEGLEFRPFQVTTGTSKFDLLLEIYEHEKRFDAIFEYNSTIFEQSTIERMISHFKNLLSAIVSDPDNHLPLFSILDKTEENQIIHEWNIGSDERPGSNFGELFEKQAAKTPHLVALAGENRQFSYSELNRKVNQLSHWLRRKGVRPEMLIGVFMDRIPEMIIAILGILKAGGAYVPLSPSYPQERLSFILHDAQIPVILTQNDLLPSLPEDISRFFCLDTGWSEIAEESEKNPTPRALPQNTAYVIYTSGSTGQPKGVAIQHDSMIHLWNALDYQIYSKYAKGKCCVSLNAPISFDASVQQLVSLLGGHTLHILPEEVRINGEKLANFIRECRMDVLDCVPSQLKLLTGAGLFGNEKWQPSICLPGGEAIDKTMWKELISEEGTDFFNMYGPTECTVDTTICHIRQKENPVIGKPIRNSQVYLLDNYMQLVPIGVIGEIYIGGFGLGRGYWNRPDLTAERFVPNPFRKKPGERLYRSGDLGRWLPDGSIEFLGRTDHQVKLRGFRIELDEIEEAMRRHPSLANVVVTMQKNPTGDNRIVGYMVAHKNQPKPAVHEMREFLLKVLPDYMIPSLFMYLDELPLTPNGKVNRKALPVPELDRSIMRNGFVAPRTPNEKILAEIWQKLLGLEKVGIRDNFFELGGDSIMSIRVVARANQAGLRITPMQMFKHQTIGGLAAVAGTARPVFAEQDILTGEANFSPIQYWFFEQGFVRQSHWNQSVLLEVGRKMSADILRQTVQYILIHHDALRMRFTNDGSGWHQSYSALTEEIPFDYFDLSSYSSERQITEVELKASELQGKLDVSKGPLIRVVYFDLGKEHADRLLIVIHHLTIDGISWRILLEDMQTVYLQLRSGRQAKLPPKTTSFRYWAKRLHEYANSDQIRKNLEYWLSVPRKDAGALPRDHGDGDNFEGASDAIVISLEEDKTSLLLRQVPEKFNTQIIEVLLTALMRAFSRWTGKRSLLIDLESHGREDLFEDIDLSRTIGWFTSLYPVWLDLEKSIEIDESLAVIKRQIRAIPDNGFGFGVMKYLSKDEKFKEQIRSLPKAEVSFNYLGQFDDHSSNELGLKLAHENKGPERNPQEKRNYLLDISGTIGDGCLHMQWLYCRNIHDRSTIVKLSQCVMDELEYIIQRSLSVESANITASDFEDVELTQEDVENIISEIEEGIDDEES